MKQCELTLSVKKMGSWVKRLLVVFSVLAVVICLLPAVTHADGEGYITFSSESSFTLKTDNSSKNWDGTLEYSTDATAWTEWAGTNTLSSSESGKLYLRGTGNTKITGSALNCRWRLAGASDIACSGNIENLLDYATVASAGHPSMAVYCYCNMFYGCTKLSAAPALPATTLSNYCYQYMFSDCTKLTAAPALPATALANYCYSSMFSRCTGITTAPVLPATTLADYCYQGMFSGCTKLSAAPALPATALKPHCYDLMFRFCQGLTAAPALPATTMADYCYGNMFAGCTGLTAAPELPATTLVTYCYQYMFSGCTGLTTAPELPATTLATYCYQDMFQNCTGLTAAPELPATTMMNSCYAYMFQSCTALTKAPALPATTLADSCYQSMFYYCSGLKISAVKTGDYTVEWRIPTEGTIAATAPSWNVKMLANTGGTYTSTPEINKTYYLFNVKKYTVTHDLAKLTATANSAGADKANNAIAYTTTLTAGSGYSLPSAVTVTIGGVTAAVGTGYTYNNTTGVVTIPAAQVTGAVVITAAAVPSCTFSLDGANAGKLMGAATAMEYSIDGVTTWTDCTADMSIPLNSLTVTDGIMVRLKAAAPSAAGPVQTIEITKADTPKLTVTQPTVRNGNGSIPMTAANEYRLSDAEDWTAADGTTELTPGTYHVRVKATGTVLASDAQQLTVLAFMHPKGGTPPTGDSGMPGLWIVLALLSAGLAWSMAEAKRKRRA